MKKSPLLAVCVAGPDMCMKKGQICEDQVTRALWFRLVEASVVFGGAVGDGRLMYLPGSDGSFSGKGSLRFDVTDMQRIGVDVNRLDSARIALLDKTLEPSFENMGMMKVQIQPIRGIDQGASHSPSFTLNVTPSFTETSSLASSDVRRRVAGLQERYASIHTLATKPCKVQRYRTITSSGRVGKGEKKTGRTLVLYVGGDKYKVSDVSCKELYEALQADEEKGIERVLFVWQGTYGDGRPNGALKWEFSTSEQIMSYQDNHKVQKAISIPAREVYEVLALERKPHSRGGHQMFARLGDARNKFFLPNVIKQELEGHLRRSCMELHDLSGWCLVRVAMGTVRTVPASKHREPPLLLFDSFRDVQIRNFADEDVPSYQSLTQSRPPSKRQRLS